jgi:putative transcriptional regulator
MLATDPECGEVVVGTGGIRKARIRRGNRGKSAGARVVYYFHGDQGLPIYILAIFTKTEKDNLSPDEKNALARFVEDTKRALKAKEARAGDSGQGEEQKSRRAEEKEEKTTMATRRAFKEIMEGLEFMRAHALGERKGGRTTVVSAPEIDVAQVRQKTGLSQGKFASIFGFSSATLKNWEQKRNVPAGAARVLLTVIDREPAAVLKALRIGPSSAAGRSKKARAAAG